MVHGKVDDVVICEAVYDKVCEVVAAQHPPAGIINTMLGCTVNLIYS
jgi:hypothetical protein